MKNVEEPIEKSKLTNLFYLIGKEQTQTLLMNWIKFTPCSSAFLRKTTGFMISSWNVKITLYISEEMLSLGSKKKIIKKITYKKQQQQKFHYTLPKFKKPTMLKMTAWQVANSVIKFCFWT